jgi:hypothetical protein
MRFCLVHPKLEKCVPCAVDFSSLNNLLGREAATDVPVVSRANAIASLTAPGASYAFDSQSLTFRNGPKTLGQLFEGSGLLSCQERKKKQKEKRKKNRKEEQEKEVKRKEVVCFIFCLARIGFGATVFGRRWRGTNVVLRSVDEGAGCRHVAQR